MKIKRRTIEKVRNWFLLAALATSLGLLYKVYVEKDWFSIKEYIVIGVEEEEREEIVHRLHKLSSGVVLYLFPKDKLLSYSHKDIVTAVSEVVPSRKDIVVGLASSQSLRIEVVEHKPVMKVSDSLGITEEGIVFPTKKSLDNFPYFDSSTTTETFEENGLTFKRLSSFDEAYIKELSSFIEKVSSVLFPVVTIKIEESGDVSLFTKEGSSKILLTSKTDLDKGWSTLVSAIDTDPLKSLLEKEREKLSYIDLRFGNKVFYKFGEKGAFQNGSSTVIIDDHATETATSTTE